MGFRGGVKLTPPQRILVFKYPSGDRVKEQGYLIHACSGEKTCKSKVVNRTWHSINGWEITFAVSLKRL